MLCLGQGDWEAVRYGPFEVATNGSERSARETLNAIVQLRWVLARRLGKQEIEPRWPVRLLLFKPDRASAAWLTPSIQLKRDAYTGGMRSGEPLPRQWLKDLTSILIESGMRRLPDSVEAGLPVLFATLEVKATRITLGIPPPVPERSKDWARMHLVLADESYAGRARVLFSVLEQGAGWDSAYRNAFEKPAAEMEKVVDAYLAAGQFPPAEIDGAPVSAQRDFRSEKLEAAAVRIRQADLLTGEAARRAYRSILNEGAKSPEALEGIELYAEAVEAGSTSARAWLGAAESEQDLSKARAAYEKAAELNPRWGEPPARLAARETDAGRKAKLLEQAAQREPRNTGYWQRLAETYLEAKEFTHAARAYREVERSAGNERERQRLETARREFEQQRLDLEQAERRRQEEEQRRELEELKQNALAGIRAAEERARGGAPPADPSRKVVEWWEGDRPAEKLSGTLERVDCLRGIIRLVIRGQGDPPVQLLIPDPKKIVIAGGGERTLGCGPQKPPRRIQIEYTPKKDAKLGTIGEVALIEFP